MKSLQQTCQDRLINDLSQAVDGVQAPARYCCGGSVLLDVYDQVVIYWNDADEDIISRKIEFPFERSPKTFKGLHRLIEACNKIGRLEAHRITTGFHPHDVGILDLISQILLPSFQGEFLKLRPQHRGVTAKFEGLYVMQGPASKSQKPFRISDDANFLGTLICCIPMDHTGGELSVLNNEDWSRFPWTDETDQNVVVDQDPITGTVVGVLGNDINSDDLREGHPPDEPYDEKQWDTSSEDSVKHDTPKFRQHALHWAAFVEDCDYQIEPIRDGFQIFLSYDLFVTERCGTFVQGIRLLESTVFPLYKGVQALFHCPAFLKKGGIIGYHCQHKYFHTNEDTVGRMPYDLRGVDLVLYTSFKALGLEVDKKPILKKKDLEDFVMKDWEHDHEFGRYNQMTPEEQNDWLRDFHQKTCGCGGQHSMKFPNAWEWIAQFPHTYAGTEFHERDKNFRDMRCTHRGRFIDEKETERHKFDRRNVINDVWPFEIKGNVIWLKRTGYPTYETALELRYMDDFEDGQDDIPFRSLVAVFVKFSSKNQLEVTEKSETPS